MGHPHLQLPCPPHTPLLPSAPHSPCCHLQVTTTVKLYGDGPLPADNYPLYYDQVHPWGPTGHR